jgi:uncharacterized protein (DUF924 family)
MTHSTTAADVLDFWFQGDPNVWRTDPWFKKSDDFDAEIRTRFALAVQAAQDGVLAPWTETPQGTLALLLLLDQFARNVHRGSHLAFAGDALARRIARTAIADGIEDRLTAVQRVFLYLPFEHSEDLADQDDSIRLFESLPPADWRESVVDYAHRHRDVILQFARFPHRNAALGRVSTPAEQAWLDAGGGF